ncbi:hypothetical protein GWI33_021262 [Rhynchophorus ferrugineus]|uniref:Uncharacterized protein n=1 Tax=Rhynchophorus ferrugineus TaxID=354439 RepID=A0A834HPB2_RHYFE|nr:hypothetical protein GWI33_021262 [Rhynchophorus ferrugineus]
MRIAKATTKKHTSSTGGSRRMVRPNQVTGYECVLVRMPPNVTDHRSTETCGAFNSDVIKSKSVRNYGKLGMVDSENTPLNLMIYILLKGHKRWETVVAYYRLDEL